jgi:hypothetical protein
VLRHWDKVLFVLALAGLVLAYGMAAGRFGLFPAPQIDTAVDTLRDWRSNWRHYLRLRPDQVLEPARFEGEGVVVHDPARAEAGPTLLAGLWGETLGFRLVAMDGSLLHSWDISLNAIFPDQSHLSEPRHDWDTLMHGMHIFANGDIVFNFSGIGVARIDACGDVVWRRPNFAHHSVFIDEAGAIWVSAAAGQDALKSNLPGVTTPVYDELVEQLGPDGELLRQISVLDAIYESGWNGPLLAKGTDSNAHREADGRDLLHLNDVEVLGSELADAFEYFAAGDIMISLRNVNTILVLDGETGLVKWSLTGPFVAQHDPDFLPNGKIGVFDNGRFDGNWAGRLPQSRVLVIDPVSQAVEIAYGRDASEAFYTARLGKQQFLDNGNVLISESQAGRVLEVTPGGAIVWSFVNRWDEALTAWLVEGQRLPPDYLEADFARCA